MADKRYTIAEAAAIMDTCKRTIKREIERGHIEAVLEKGRYGPQWFISELPGTFKGAVVNPGVVKAKAVKKTKAQPVTRADFDALLDEIHALKDTQQAMLQRVGQTNNTHPRPAPKKAKPKRQVKDRGERLEYAEQLIKDDPERKLSHADIQAKIAAKYGQGIRLDELIKMRAAQARKGGKK